MKKDYKYTYKHILLQGVEKYYFIVITLEYELNLDVSGTLCLEGLDLIFKTREDAEEYIQNCIDKKSDEIFSIQEYTGNNQAYLCCPVKLIYYANKIKEALDARDYKSVYGDYDVLTENEKIIRICFKESEFDVLYDFEDSKIYFNPYNNKTRTAQEIWDITKLLKNVEQTVL